MAYIFRDAIDKKCNFLALKLQLVVNDRRITHTQAYLVFRTSYVQGKNFRLHNVTDQNSACM